jgi:hypothetical protein
MQWWLNMSFVCSLCGLWAKQKVLFGNQSKSLKPLYSDEYSLVKQREETRILIVGIYSGVGSNGGTPNPQITQKDLAASLLADERTSF